MFTAGAIIGVIAVVDAHPAAGCCAPWGDDGYLEHGTGRVRRDIWHLVLEDAVLIQPVLCRGALGLWTVPGDVELDVAAGLAAAGTLPAAVTH